VSEELCAAQRDGLVTRAWLIGSLTGDRFGDGSDVDVVVEGLRPDAVGTLWDRLEVRVEGPVDVLRFESLPDGFRARVLREGVALPGPRFE
jgi:predicted nucleotidyltransferase